MKIKPVHPETAEILANVRTARKTEEITCEQYDELVKSYFRFEIEGEVLGHFPENQLEEAEAYLFRLRNEGLT
jgi:hypothetical protein